MLLVKSRTVQRIAKRESSEGLQEVVAYSLRLLARSFFSISLSLPRIGQSSLVYHSIS